MNKNTKLIRYFSDDYSIQEQEYKKRLESLVDILSLSRVLNSQVRSLSLGERMKAEIAGSVLHYPRILFLDEPTIGLDFTAKQSLRSFFRTLQKERGTTLLLTSHDIDDVETVCDRVVIINVGSVVFDDSIQILSSLYGSDKYVTFLFETPVEESIWTAVLKTHGWKRATEALQNKDHKIYEVVESLPTKLESKVAKQHVPDLLSLAIQSFQLADIELPSAPLEHIIKKMY